jgi:hypothetical protein
MSTSGRNNPIQATSKGGGLPDTHLKTQDSTLQSRGWPVVRRLGCLADEWVSFKLPCVSP